IWLAVGATDMRTGFRQPGGAGANRVGKGPVLRGLRGWRWAVLVCQAVGARPIRVARAEEGVAVPTPAQLSMLLEGIDDGGRCAPRSRCWPADGGKVKRPEGRPRQTAAGVIR